jgi:hypothetical protein
LFLLIVQERLPAVAPDETPTMKFRSSPAIPNEEGTPPAKGDFLSCRLVGTFHETSATIAS